MTARRSLDGFVPKRPHPGPLLRATPPVPVMPAAASKPPTRQHVAATAPVKRRRWWQPLLLLAIILLCLSASFLVESLPLGMAAIAIYAAIAWAKRLPSRYSFSLAVLSLGTVIVLLLVRQDVLLASNFATYTFLFLVIGTVAALIEPGAYPKRRNSKIPNLRCRFRL